jgi:uncharacterized membrane protein YoaK (UPF0700 family)
MSNPIVQKPAIRAIPLICLLCAIAGSVDAVAYLLCGQVFVANMTGNTVLFAISLLQREMSAAALRGALVGAFLAGVIVARLLAKKANQRVTKRQRILVLVIQALILLLLAWRSTGTHMQLLLLLLAGMLGTQNGAFQYIGGVHLNTTFITGDLEKLGEAVTDVLHSFTMASAFLLSWIGYAGGAVLGALGAKSFPQHAYLVPMILTLASAVAVMMTPEQLWREVDER